MLLIDTILKILLLLALIIGMTAIAILLNEKQKTDNRPLTKLKLFYLCDGQAKKEEEILQEYQTTNRMEMIDEKELRKALYEMLKEGTLRYRSDGTFKAHQVKAADRETEG